MIRLERLMADYNPTPAIHVMDTNVRPNMGCVRANIGLTRQIDRRELENYFKPCYWIKSLLWPHMKTLYCSVVT